MGDRLLPGDPDHPVAVGLEDALALTIGRSLERVVVVRAVGFDHEALLGPMEVGDDPAA